MPGIYTALTGSQQVTGKSSGDEELKAELRRLISGYQVSQAIYVAARLRLAELLHYGPADCASLARAVGADDGAIFRLLRELSSVGLFTDRGDRRFAITPLGELLRGDAQDSLHSRALLAGQEWIWRPWSRLFESVVSGRSSFESIYGRSFFEYLSDDATAREIFQAAMTSGTARKAELIESFDFSSARSVVDIGGGYGGLVVALLMRYPALVGVVFERMEVAVGARIAVARTEVAARCAVVAGDFRQAVSVTADVYVLSQVLHDWSEDEAVAILRNCRRAMRSRSRLFLIERMPSQDGSERRGRLSDLNMLVLLGGRERSLDEYEQLLVGADYTPVWSGLVSGGWGVVEARPAS